MELQPPWEISDQWGSLSNKGKSGMQSTCDTPVVQQAIFLRAKIIRSKLIPCISPQRDRACHDCTGDAVSAEGGLGGYVIL